MTNKKILLFINALKGGGAERVCITLANSFAHLGLDTNLLVLNLNNAVLKGQIDEYVTLTNLKTNHTRNSAVKLFKYLRKKPYNTILVFNHQIAVFLAILRIVFRFNLKIVARNINTLSLKRQYERSLWQRYIVDLIIKMFYKKVDLIIAQSEGMKADLIKHYNIPPSRCVTIYNPVNQVIENHLEKNGLETKSPSNYLLCVGRLEKAKSFEYAIKAFSEISNEYQNLKLIIVGEGSMKNNLILQTKKSGLSDRVIFEGFKMNMVPYYSNANATLLTSIYEGFPNVLIESIRLGTPVVAFDCKSGPNEIIQNGINGFLVRYQDRSHLKESIKKVLNKKWDRKLVSETAKQYSTKFIVNRYIDVLFKTR